MQPPSRPFLSPCFIAFFSASAVYAQQTCPAVDFYVPRTLPSYSSGNVLGFVNVMGSYKGYIVPSNNLGEAMMNSGLLSQIEPCFPNPNHKNPSGNTAQAPGVAQAAQIVAVTHTSGTLDWEAAYVTIGTAATVTVYQLNPMTLMTQKSSVVLNGEFAGQPVILADFNGDHIPDLIATVTQNGANYIAYVPGNADGTFGTPVYYSFSDSTSNPYPSGVTAADLNADGKLDLVIAGANVQIWLGKGDGTFQPPITLALPQASRAAIAGDLNGDGKPDLGLALADGGLAVAFGNGDGTFGTPVAYSVAGAAPSLGCIAAGDFNNDGALDLALCDGLTAPVFLNQGNGTFNLSHIYTSEDPVLSIVVTDLDNDGNQDLVFGTGSQAVVSGVTSFGTDMTVLFGNGDGSFLGMPVTYAPPKSFAVGDFNKDGKPDFAGVTQNQNLVTYFGGAQVTAGAMTQFPYGLQAAVAAADFNGDGNVDVALGTTSLMNGGAPGLQIGLGNGDGTFRVGATAELPVAPLYGAAADLNGDGKPDLVLSDEGSFATGSGALSILLNQGGGQFGTPANYSFAGGAGPLVLGDFNGDGKLDIAIVASEDASQSQALQVYIFEGNGDGTFNNPQLLNGTMGAIQLASADLNADGKTDLVVLSLNSPTSTWNLQIFTGSSAGLTAGAMYPTGFGPQSPVIADFNGDGKPDMFIPYCCGGGEPAGLRLGNGDGTFGAEALYGGLGDVQWATAADFNGDGKPDLAVSVDQPGELGIAINETQKPGGLGIVTAAGFATAPVAPESIVAIFGTNLANSTATASTVPLPNILNQTSVSIQDAKGVAATLPLFFVSSGQVNAYVPSGVASGAATVTVTSPLGVSTGTVQIANVAPGIFTANSSGLAAAQAVVTVNGTTVYEPVDMVDSSGNVVAAPIDLSQGTTYLVLYGTGIRHAQASQVTATIGGVNAPVVFTGAQPSFTGLDQLNLQIPASLAGKGNVPVIVTVTGLQANTVNIAIR